MAFAHTRQQGNKKDSAQQKPHQSRGNNKKHASTNVATNRGTAKESPEEAEMARHLHDRMLFLLACLTGSVVQVTVKGGAKFEGVFHGASTEGDIGVALKHARKIYDPAAPPSEKQKSNPYPVKNSILFMGKDVVEIVSMETDLTAGDAPLPEKDTFKTDADISGRTEIKERELHKWNPETHDGEHFETLEGDSEMTSNGEAWDQFAANEKLFGLKTDFDEEIYTTRLDRNAPDFKDREKWAIEKANEIQRSAATNVHVLEERGLAVDDSEMDEEDRYGAVVRDNNNNNANKYMPPALRKQAPSTKKEGEGVRSGNPLQNLMTSNLPKAVVTAPSPVTNLPNARQEAGASFTNAAGEKPGEAHSAKRIEAEIAKTFRQFAMQEKDKLHAKKQALQKKEKEERLAELMKFHQTFKLNVPVPSDLVPLLSKGKRTSGSSSSGEKSTIPSPDTKKKSTEQQQQQQQQQQQAQQTETKKPAATEEQPAKTEPAKTESKPAKSGFKFNVKAMEFKPNPAAPVFVPGAKPVTTSTTAAPAESERPVKKIPGKQHLTISEAFSSPFSKKKDTSPGSVRPTWPFGTQRYHDLFNQQYNGDMYPNYASPGYSYGYSTYHYPPQYVQSMSPMQMPQGAPVPYMSPQFVHNVPLTAPMPHAAAPPAVGYSPQMANVSPHGSPFPQHFHSPQRSPIIPQGVPPHQAYQYQAPAPHHGAPMMMGYPPDAAPPNMTPGLGPVMIQRPVMGEPGPMHYPQQHPEHATPNSDAQAAEASPTTR